MSSAVATIAVAFLGASGTQKIWINSRTTQQHFQTEQFLFNQQAGRYHDISQDEAIRMFSERMVVLWDKGHGKWEQNVGDDQLSFFYHTYPLQDMKLKKNKNEIS